MSTDTSPTKKFILDTEKWFDQLSQSLLSQLRSDEELALSLNAEQPTYLRFNQSKLRQNTVITNIVVDFSLTQSKKRSQASIVFTGNIKHDLDFGKQHLLRLRDECESLPEDPLVTAVPNGINSDQKTFGQMPQVSQVLSLVTELVGKEDFAGLFAMGPHLKAYVNSKKLRHWFSTESYFLDYSIYAVNLDGKNKAVKGSFSGTDWDPKGLQENLEFSKSILPALKNKNITLKPGKYKAYLAPAAVAEVMGVFSWGGTLSLSSFKKGLSAFSKLIKNEEKLSPLFTLKENFSSGSVPAFNSFGEVAAPTMSVIQNGKIENLLISARSEKEYGDKSNGAEVGGWGGEFLRSPEIEGGTLPQSETLKQLGTGIFISNLHYINWSDITNARITGMTRYACLWVEDGKIIAPIEDMRFDMSLYNLLGDRLINLTEQQVLDPNTDTYFFRSIGGRLIPGALVKDFEFSL